MEVAAALTDKAHSVSIIGMQAIPFRKAFGEKVGKAIMKVEISPPPPHPFPPPYSSREIRFLTAHV